MRLVSITYCFYSYYWRRGRDSNPRWGISPYSLSRGAPSAARPPLLAVGREHTRGCPGRKVSNTRRFLRTREVPWGRCPRNGNRRAIRASLTSSDVRAGGVPEGFRDLLVADATVVRLHRLLAQRFPRDAKEFLSVSAEASLGDERGRGRCAEGRGDRQGGKRTPHVTDGAVVCSTAHTPKKSSDYNSKVTCFFTETTP